RITANRVEFNYGDGTAVFEQAWGIVSLGEAVDRAPFGNQDPDVYFWGERIERLSTRRYRITDGGFTACVQPTPRWSVTSSTVVLNLDDYAAARHTVLRVKSVPLLYLPVIYYPIQEDERATGFLMPTYGASTLRGQAVSNAFFWAIGRSHDATFFHDWFTRAGQGAGAEYRYVAGQASSGNVRLYRFRQRETMYVHDGRVTQLPENTSFEISANVVQALPRAMRARARVDYFSDVVSQQLYHQNLYQASRRNRLVEGGVTAPLGPVSASLSYRRSEVFDSVDRRDLYGSTPRVAVSLAPQRLFEAPVYASVNGEYAFLPYRRFDRDVLRTDNSLSRLDVTPTVRVPLSRLTFLSVNTSAAYRTTYYSRSQDARQRVIDDPYLRQYATVRSEVVGPVFTRIWDLPRSRWAERLKHVVEPAFTLDFTSRIADYRRVPVLTDASDVVVGGTTRFTYGLTNRVLSRAPATDGMRGQTREFLTVGLQQTYYSSREANQYDPAYQSTFGGRRLRDLSPLALTVRFSPSNTLDATSRVEYDVSGAGLTLLSAGGGLRTAAGSLSLSYSHRSVDRSEDYLTASTTITARGGRVTGAYSVSWDISRGYVVNQSVSGTYMAQCCGFLAEFQQFNYPQSSGFPLPADRRVNVGLVLAGLGTFSNFFGAFGGSR
ncbi:MAG TPA: putative LPS assembly protein LptD, partial [Vicinamibacterales bacterium]|nr:putative LPS assembly protein LptD [Vicinamibacterales bacterium]